jgi:hypothetical protein
MRVVLKNEFFHDGRGPELRHAHYSATGSSLLAVEYVNPPLGGRPYGEVRHLLFVKPQVFMFTPEEVENYEANPAPWGSTENGAAVCLGHSAWLHSFSQRHLAQCEHYRLMFYDEFLDIICEGIEAKQGGYGASG